MDPQPAMPRRFIRLRKIVRRTWPWIFGIVVVAFVARKVPFDAFREALGSGLRPGLVAVELLAVVLALGTDAIATWFALVAAKMQRPVAQIAAVRGASFVLFLVNYVLGQGAFGYYLKRTGASGFRATGATLFLIGTNLATLLLLATLAWGIRGEDLDTKLWTTLVVGSAAFGVYLVIIGIAPRVLADREVLAPLFDAGVVGTAIAVATRIPYVMVMTFGPWVAMRVWGIPVPFATAASTMPMVVVASALPIAPAGLGTMQASMVYFFSSFAEGATSDIQGAHVFAFSIVHFVYTVLATLLVGLACIPFARRSGGLPSSAPAEKLP